MTNIAFQDIAGGSIHVYTGNKNLPKWDRINSALKELKHTGCIRVMLYKNKKFRTLLVKGF